MGHQSSLSVILITCLLIRDLPSDHDRHHVHADYLLPNVLDVKVQSPPPTTLYYHSSVLSSYARDLPCEYPPHQVYQSSCHSLHTMAEQNQLSHTEIAKLARDFQENWLKNQIVETENLQKQLLESTVSSVKNRLQAAVGSLSQRQDTYEQNSTIRIESLTKQLDSILDLLHQQRAHQGPGGENLSNTPSPPDLTSISTSGPNSPSTPPLSYSAASRTLGFAPVTSLLSPSPLPTLQSTSCPQLPLAAYTSLQDFLHDKLCIPHDTCLNLSYNTIFREGDSDTVFVEFQSSKEISIIFKHVHHLPRNCTVRRYIPPSLRDQFRLLSEKSSEMRKVDNKHQTKISYGDDGLKLFARKYGDPDWRIVPIPDKTKELSSICQLDGTDDLALLSPANSPVNSSPTAPSDSRGQAVSASHGQAVSASHDQGPSVSHGQAPYFLNQAKQAAKICRDADSTEMKIVINNNNTNVNIQCNTGFYLVVAKPFVTGFSQGSTCQYPPVQVCCNEVYTSVDRAGVNGFSRLSFHLKGPDLSMLGTVQVHLHHTTRLVQVQGSAIMHDKTTSAVWFADHVITDRFKQLAKTKQFDITSFNTKMLEMSRAQHEAVKSGKYCSHCGKIFLGQSKPSQCTSCNSYIHRGCIRNHNASCTSNKTSDSQPRPPSPQRPNKRLRTLNDSTHSSQAVITVPSQVSNAAIPLGISPPISSSPPVTTRPLSFLNSLTTNLINSGVPTFTGISSSVSFVPTVSVSNTAGSITSIPAENPSQPEQQPRLMADISNPGARIFIPGSTSMPFISSSSAPSTNTTTNRTSRKPKAKANVSSEAAQIDYLTTELNYTHSKIVSQDSTIKDLEYKVKILTEKLKISDEKLNSDLHRRYFGQTDTNLPVGPPCLGTQCHASTSVPPPQSCSTCSQTPACSSRPHYYCQGYHGHPRLVPMPPPNSSNNQCKNLPSSSQDNHTSQDLFTALKEDIDVLRVEILQLKTKVDSLTAPNPPGSPINSGIVHHTQFTATADIHQPPENVDSVSIASIEEDIEIVEVDEAAQISVEEAPVTSGNSKN